jgi:uncharacterized RDD family membrane protein YckC
MASNPPHRINLRDRLGAVFVDFFVVVVPLNALVYVDVFVDANLPLSNYTFIVVYLAYYSLSEYYYGTTLGKRELNLTVVTKDGTPISLKQSFTRNVFRLVDFLPAFYLLGAVSIWNSPSRQRIGDIIAGTFVVEQGETPVTELENKKLETKSLAEMGKSIPGLDWNSLFGFIFAISLISIGAIVAGFSYVDVLWILIPVLGIAAFAGFTAFIYWLMLESHYKPREKDENDK